MLLETMGRIGKNKEFGESLMFRHKEVRGEDKTFEERSEELV